MHGMLINGVIYTYIIVHLNDKKLVTWLKVTFM